MNSEEYAKKMLDNREISFPIDITNKNIISIYNGDIFNIIHL